MCPLHCVTLKLVNKDPSISKFSDDFPRSIGTMAVDDYDVFCPQKFHQYALDIDFLVISQNDGCDICEPHRSTSFRPSRSGCITEADCLAHDGGSRGGLDQAMHARLKR